MKRALALSLMIATASAGGSPVGKVGYQRLENAAGIGHLWYTAVPEAEPKARRYLPLPVSRKVSVAEEGTWLGRLLRPSVFKDPEGIVRARAHDQIFAWIQEFPALDARAASASHQGEAP